MSEDDKRNLYLKWLDLYASALTGVAMRSGWSAEEVAAEASNIADAALKVAAHKAEQHAKDFANA